MSDLLVNLVGRNVVVTGGGGHIGAAIAVTLASAGASVIVCGRHIDLLTAVAERAGALSGGRVYPIVADVSTDEGLTRVLDETDRVGGRLDGWVNNAYAGPMTLLGASKREDVAETLARGLGDVIMATQAAAERMRERGGAIVNIASMYGVVSPQPSAYRGHPDFHSPPAYGAAKAGVIAFTRYAAVHLAGDNIRVNAISPGPFPGPKAVAETDFEAELAKRVPLGRIGQPRELGPAVAFLLSDAASYVTGHNLVVDGGWTVW